MHILITGASGNVGGALARQLAAPGVSLSLWGRDEARLAEIAGACEARGAAATWQAVDLANLDAALALLSDLDDLQPFDMALLVAGLGGTQAAGDLVEDAAQVARQCHLNLTVPAAMAAHLGARMGKRGRGKIGIIGSAAGFHALPFAPSYAGSKAGLARFADALRLAARRHGVTITLAAPGFIAAPAPRDNNSARPFEMPVEKAAAAIIAAVIHGRARIVFPKRFIALRWLDQVLPRPLRDRLLLALPAP